MNRLMQASYWLNIALLSKKESIERQSELDFRFVDDKLMNEIEEHLLVCSAISMVADLKFEQN